APPPVYEAGEGVGFLHVPAPGRGYQALIGRGTCSEVLEEGDHHAACNDQRGDQAQARRQRAQEASPPLLGS
ncbi:hypothetical protein, partial [Saccharothrix sp. ST-888]|uniref:hypothetical protein n=1 Tax=Saccharothrix sp. ST-888 TaxID=1427391 RepID=UPI0005EC3641